MPQITAAVITNLETRRRPGREVTTEELLALAWVLDVPPVQLLAPLGEGQALEVVPGESPGPLDILAWMADDPSPAQMSFLRKRDEEGRPLPYKRSVLAVIRQLARATWQVRMSARILGDEELLALTHDPASRHEESIRSNARQIRSELTYLAAACHDVALPADAAEVIARYEDPALVEDECGERDGPDALSSGLLT